MVLTISPNRASRKMDFSLMLLTPEFTYLMLAASTDLWLDGESDLPILSGLEPL
jgi:hypothetical protein